MLICVTVLIMKHDLFNYFHIGNVNTQNNVLQTGFTTRRRTATTWSVPLSVNASKIIKSKLKMRRVMIPQ